MKSLFGHIVLRFTSEAENLATESLFYLLSNSKPANDAFFRFINNIQNINSDLTFRTQVYDEDESIPDLVGFDNENDQICIIESKFWAGLTHNQPISYIKRFNQSKKSIILFLVPAKRIDSIWSELTSKCKKSGLVIEKTVRKPHVIHGSLNKNHEICVTDWNSLLKVIETELDAVGDYITKSDLIQLRGLCDQMDEEAFLPIDPQEISPMIAKRNIQFAELVDNVIAHGISKDLFQLDGLKQSSGTFHYGRYFKINDYNFNFKFDNRLWNELRNTPFWLQVFGKGWRHNKEERIKIKKVLVELESDDYGIFYDVDDLALVPIELEFRVEKEEVVKSLTNQIYKIFLLLDEKYE
jgi:hypothetical protein